MPKDFKPKGWSQAQEKALYKNPLPQKSVRPKRVAETIRQGIAALLVQGRIEGLPLNAFVTVSHVDVSPDLAQGVVFVSWMEMPQISSKEIMEALRNSESMVRTYLAKTLSLRRVPKILFKSDMKQPDPQATLEALFQSNKVQKDIKK